MCQLSNTTQTSVTWLFHSMFIWARQRQGEGGSGSGSGKPR
jgi:hypothetical protein